MKNISGVLKGVNDKKVPKKLKRTYVTSGFLRTVYNKPEDFIKTEKLFDIAQKNLANATFNEKIFTTKSLLVSAMALNNAVVNFDKTSELMKKVANESDMRECGKKFVENFGWDESANNV